VHAAVPRPPGPGRADICGRFLRCGAAVPRPAGPGRADLPGPSLASPAPSPPALGPRPRRTSLARVLSLSPSFSVSPSIYLSLPLSDLCWQALARPRTRRGTIGPDGHVLVTCWSRAGHDPSRPVTKPVTSTSDKALPAPPRAMPARPGPARPGPARAACGTGRKPERVPAIRSMSVGGSSARRAPRACATTAANLPSKSVLRNSLSLRLCPPRRNRAGPRERERERESSKPWRP
jgi:hypothetical protein